ncbi:MAG: hypothetical protein JNL11_00900 [Bdellovibrionaceae bacterium]|nr:hypothetical protein [Pseudobdellovibrionaceae bacterium]
MKWLGVLCMSLMVSSPLWAADFPGGTSSSAVDDEFEKGFGKSTGMQDEDHRMVEADRMKMGGYLQAEWMAYQLVDRPIQDYITSPMTLEMYIDAQMKNDVRAFFKGRFLNDGSVDESKPSPLTGGMQKQSTAYLDEMKISFHTRRKIFWTIGRQKIKWGVSKFWNPTDFINMQKRDFLRQEDLRTGISMVKAHVPWNDANFYVLGVTEASSESNQNGLGGRFELPIQTSEWSVSAYSRKGQSTKLGSDISFALKDFDVCMEGAQTDLGTEKAASGGFTYEVKYSDEDTVALGLEGFWQENGNSDKSSYGGLLASGKFIPFNVGKSYSSASVVLLKPGSWNFSTLLFFAIQNNDDRSQYYRATWIYSGISDMLWTVALGSRAGDVGSEMKMFNQTYDAWLQMRVIF